MKICAIADQHAQFPEIPKCDLLLISGDICYHGKNIYLQKIWIQNAFIPWLKSLRSHVNEIMLVAGNHDSILETDKKFSRNLPVIYLEDTVFHYKGIHIYGSPWQPRFYDWAFNADEKQLSEYWKLIPNEVDILLLHGPPYGCLDYSSYGNVHTGSPSLRERIIVTQPKIVLAGHIHAGRRQGIDGNGVDYIGESRIINCSITDDNYKLAYDPVVFEYP